MKPESSKVDSTVFIADTATVVGDVTIGKDSSVWFSAVLRGDAAPVIVGEETNVQDSAVLHVDHEVPCRVGNRVTIGHGAIVHGATVEDDVLIGLGALVLNRSHIGSFSIIAAGALVPEETVIPPYSLVMGVPGKIVRQVNEEEIELIKRGCEIYTERAKNYQKGIYK